MIDTSPSLALVLLVVVLVGTGVYLLLERSLTRIIIGIGLLSNGINVIFLIASGRAGGAPLVGETPPDEMSDPLPQAMVLTAIVITLGLTAFLLSLAYRAWQLNGHDEVQDDLEDRRIARRGDRDHAPCVHDPPALGAGDEELRGAFSFPSRCGSRSPVADSPCPCPEPRASSGWSPSSPWSPCWPSR